MESLTYLGTSKVVLHEEGKTDFWRLSGASFSSKNGYESSTFCLGRNYLLGLCSWVDLVLYHIAYALVHEPGFSGHDAGNIEQDVLGMIIIVLFYCRLLWLVQLIHFLLPATLVSTDTLFSLAEDRGSTFVCNVGTDILSYTVYPL